MSKNDVKLIVDKINKEASKLEKRYKDAEQRLKLRVHQFDEKIVNSYKRRKALLEDKRDQHNQNRQIEKIEKNAEKIKKIVFNTDFPLSGHERRQFIRLIAKIQASYSDLNSIFGHSRRNINSSESDAYFDMGVNIAELSEDLVDLLLDQDVETQAMTLATCNDIEESCDTLSERANARYSKAA